MKLIFITGVSRGLGLALSKTLDDGDTRIVGFSRSRGEYEGEFHSIDFSKPQLTASIFDQAFEEPAFAEASSIVFISNAGQLGPLDFIERLDTLDIQENLTANLVASAVALSHFLKYTTALDKPKLFIQITSGVAQPGRAKPGWSLYSASKAGQDQLLRAVALEQKHALYPAKVVSINPGVMETAMQQQIRDTPKESFPDVETFIQLKDQGKLSEPATIAERIGKLIADYTTLESGTVYEVGANSSSPKS